MTNLGIGTGTPYWWTDPGNQPWGLNPFTPCTRPHVDPISVIDFPSIPAHAQRSTVDLSDLTQPWELEKGVLTTLVELVALSRYGAQIDSASVPRCVRAGPTAAAARPLVRGDGIGVIPIRGVILPSAEGLPAWAQVTGLDEIERKLQQLQANDAVDAIVLDIDSPGGVAAGVAEVAEQIAASTKPVHAYAQGLMASAAYHLASRARSISASKSSLVGAIGTFIPVLDTSEHFAKQGIKVHTVKSGKHKGDGIPGTVVDEAVLADQQRIVDSLADLFIEDVAAGRRLSPDRARELADGRAHVASRALDEGLIDAVQTFDQAVRSFDRSPVTAHPVAAVATTWEGEMTEQKNAAPAPIAQPLAGATARDVATVNPQAYAEIAKEAVRVDRERRAAIQAMAITGQEKLAEQLIADGIDPKDAAVALLADAKASQGSRLQQLRDERKAVGVAPDEEVVAAAPRGAAGSFEERAAADWKRDPQLRDKYGDRFESYLGFLRMEQNAATR